MYRIAMENLLQWKHSKRRKPLIIEGTHRGGKTWLTKEFGRRAYAETISRFTEDSCPAPEKHITAPFLIGKNGALCTGYRNMPGKEIPTNITSYYNKRRRNLP